MADQRRYYLGARVWVLVDGKKHPGTLAHSDDAGVIIRQDAKPHVMVLPRRSEGSLWGFEEDT